MNWRAKLFILNSIFPLKVFRIASWVSTFLNAAIMGCRWSWGTWFVVAVSHRHSAWSTWKWQRSCRAEAHVSFRALFSAWELSVMKAAGACRSRGVHEEAMGFGAILKCLILDRLSGTVAPCRFYLSCRIKKSMVR